jgi:hypothetical protein
VVVFTAATPLSGVEGVVLVVLVDAVAPWRGMRLGVAPLPIPQPAKVNVATAATVALPTRIFVSSGRTPCGYRTRPYSAGWEPYSCAQWSRSVRVLSS